MLYLLRWPVPEVFIVNETLTELKQWKYASTETAAATDCRYLDYDSNPARIQ